MKDNFAFEASRDPVTAPRSDQKLATTFAGHGIFQEEFVRVIADRVRSSNVNEASRGFKEEEAKMSEDRDKDENDEDDDVASEQAVESSTTSTKRMRKKLKKLSVNLSMCKYSVIEQCCQSLGWKITDSESNWHLFWTDMSVGEERCMRIRRPQKLNHFPGMQEIAHKCKLAKNLNRMQQELPSSYNFHPETFSLPVEFNAFQRAALGEGKEKKSKKTYIVKPDDGACGVGIFLTRKPSSIPRKLSCVAQRYMGKPLLIEGKKFDLRLYVLVTNMVELRAYLFSEGLARFASEAYEKVGTGNMQMRYMHLTNYSVNKQHKDFETDDEANASRGSKRSLGFVRAWLRANGYDVKKIWEEIEKCVVKTLLAVQPHVAHAYRTSIAGNHDSVGFSCFDLLGFDILLDEEGKPWVIEVNEMPSFDTAAPIDEAIKQAVVTETLLLVCPTLQEVRLLAELRETSRKGSTGTLNPGGQQVEKDGMEKGREVEGRRQELIELRKRQEDYHRRCFRRIHPLTSPEEDGRWLGDEPKGGRGGAKALEGFDYEWNFVEVGKEEAEERDERLKKEYEECARVAQGMFTSSVWSRGGRQADREQTGYMRTRTASVPGRGEEAEGKSVNAGKQPRAVVLQAYRVYAGKALRGAGAGAGAGMDVLRSKPQDGGLRMPPVPGKEEKRVRSVLGGRLR